ncbi:hypothetical protein HY486_04085 [Candidatus Woesearchaeota archaeon]|nr:hypothetical protein [Candidatus Woesearchaeota archaeon]
MALTEFDTKCLNNAVQRARRSFEKKGYYPMGAVLSAKGEIIRTATTCTEEFPDLEVTEHKQFDKYAVSKLLLKEGLLNPSPDARKKRRVLYTSLIPDMCEIGFCMDAGISRIVCASPCPATSIKEFLDELTDGTEGPQNFPVFEEHFIPEAGELFASYLDRWREAHSSSLCERNLLYFKRYPEFIRNYQDSAMRESIKEAWMFECAEFDLEECLQIVADCAIEKEKINVPISAKKGFLSNVKRNLEPSSLPYSARLYAGLINAVRNGEGKRRWGEIVLSNNILVLNVSKSYIDELRKDPFE